ncbi:glycine cleavage system H protein [Gaertneriomyces semiglobifer]|nr:glycine cleavage system H protein [Gaertneriomyces semiglobifer]
MFFLLSHPFPIARLYTVDHEFISLPSEPSSLAKDAIATIGITPYAAKALGDVVFVESPTVSSSFQKGDTVAAVESVKAASDILAPVSGEIVEVNEKLEEKPGLVNEDPFEKGWIAKIKISDPSELSQLLDEAAYAKHTSE